MLKPDRSNARIELSLIALAGAVILAGEVYAQGAPPGRHKPPPEAYAACDSKAAADACTVSFRDKTISGVCTADESAKLFCRPDHMPPPPGEKPPDEEKPEGEPPARE